MSFSNSGDGFAALTIHDIAFGWSWLPVEERFQLCFAGFLGVDFTHADERSD
jgi:hypothetical protein